MIGYTHLIEFLPDRESKISGIFMLIDGLVYVISPLILTYITKDLDFFILVAFGLNLLSLILFALLRVPESLKYLLTNG